jgi:hypothetical protein
MRLLKRGIVLEVSLTAGMLFFLHQGFTSKNVVRIVRPHNDGKRR